MKLIIIEDEAHAAKNLQRLVKEIDPTIEVVSVLDSVEASVKWISDNPPPDLILMDIELADGQSFEIFAKADVQSPVIFTTAYDEFALKAFKVNSIDYLLKPIKMEELKNAVDKFYVLNGQPKDVPQNAGIEKLLQSLYAQQSSEKYRTRFLVKSGQRLIPLTTENISYFFTENKLVFIRTNENQKFFVDYTLDDLEQSLDPRQFFRANRQFIISTTSVETIHPWFNSKLKVDIKPKPDEEVVISREKANDFKKWLGE
jgi:two-component system response regulator LytT